MRMMSTLNEWWCWSVRVRVPVHWLRERRGAPKVCISRSIAANTEALRCLCCWERSIEEKGRDEMRPESLLMLRWEKPIKREAETLSSLGHGPVVFLALSTHPVSVDKEQSVFSWAKACKKDIAAYCKSDRASSSLRRSAAHDVDRFR